jgi:type IV fimbrial biogenesis protein FimT
MIQRRAFMLTREKNDKGVTLVELVVVFALIAILAVLMVPSVSPWLLNYRLRGATRDVVSTMRTAQMKAVSNNVRFRVNFNAADLGGTDRYVLQHDSGGIWVDVGALQTLPSGVTMNVGLLPDGRAVFNENSTSSGGSITLQNSKGSTRTITLSSVTGRVSIP